jgi:hypothetical protein
MAKANTTETVKPGQFSSRLRHTRQALVARGRSIGERLPGAVDGVRGSIDAASGQLEQLSDEGVRSALGISAGVTIGLFLAGAPRVILGVALIPVAIIGHATMQRGASSTIAAQH